MRWLKEFFNPSLKCQRVGHNPVVVKVTIRKPSNSFRTVARDYKADIGKCKRCGKVISEPCNLEFIDAWTSVEMPKYMWDDIRNNGYVIL